MRKLAFVTMLDFSDISQQKNKLIVRQPRQYLDEFQIVFIHCRCHLLILNPPEVTSILPN